MENRTENEPTEESPKPEYHEFDEGLKTVQSRTSEKFFDYYLIDEEPSDFELPKLDSGVSLAGLTFETFHPETLEVELDHIPDMSKPEYDPRRYFSYKFKRSPPPSPPRDRKDVQQKFMELFAKGETFSCIDEEAAKDLSFDTRYPNYFGSDFNYLNFPVPEKCSPPRQESYKTFVLKKRIDEVPPWRERADKAESVPEPEPEKVPSEPETVPSEPILEIVEPLNLSEDDNVASNWDDNLSEDNVAQLEILSPNAQQEKLFEEQCRAQYSFPTVTQSEDQLETQFDAYWEVQPLFQVHSEPQIRIPDFQPKIEPQDSISQDQFEPQVQLESGSHEQFEPESQTQSRVPSSEQIPTVSSASIDNTIDNEIDSLFTPEYQYLYDLADEYNETMEMLRNLTLEMALNNPNPLSKYKTYEEYLEGEAKFQKDCAEHFKREADAFRTEQRKQYRSKTNLHVYFDTNVTKWSNPSSVASEASEEPNFVPFSYQDCEQNFIGPKPQYWVDFNSLDEIGRPVVAYDSQASTTHQKSMQPIWIDPDVDLNAPIVFSHDYNLILEFDSIEELLCLESLVAEEGRVCKVKIRTFPSGKQGKRRDEKQSGGRDEQRNDKRDENQNERRDKQPDEKQNERQDDKSEELRDDKQEDTEEDDRQDTQETTDKNNETDKSDEKQDPPVDPTQEKQESVEEEPEITHNVAFNPENFPFLTGPGAPKPESTPEDVCQKTFTDDLPQDEADDIETYASKLKKAKSAPGMNETRSSRSFIKLPYVRSSQSNIRTPCKPYPRPPGPEKHVRRVFWRSDVKSYEKEKIEQEEVRSAEKKLAGEIPGVSSPGKKPVMPKDKDAKEVQESKDTKDQKKVPPKESKEQIPKKASSEPLVKKVSFKESKDQDQMPKSPEKSRPAFEKKTKSQPSLAKPPESTPSTSSNIGGKKAKRVIPEPWVSVKKRGSKPAKDVKEVVKPKTPNKPPVPNQKDDPKKEKEKKE